MSTTTPQQTKTLRKDIQALRAIAIVAVVLFHLWPSRLRGGFVGVDVFFVISGFLITTHLLKEVESNTFKVSHFWVRRVRRLLPASFTVLAVTAITVIAVVPIQLWLQWLKEVQASILYFENWVLALDSVDYLALANQASPTQHFWSLSVEEQFYLVWPVLIALAILLVRKRSLKAKRLAMLTILSLVTVTSFVYGVYFTQAEPAIAYFSTPVRAWEFGVGALVAFAPSIKNATASLLVTAVGLLFIAFASYRYSTAIPFPGYWALTPVLATAAVIWAASNEGIAGKVFGLKPIAWLGDKSYSIYLWHWPILILFPYLLGAELGTATKLLALAITLVLAGITTAEIERPFLAGGSVPKFKPAVVFGTLALVSSLMVGSLAFGTEHAKATIAAEKEKAEQILKGKASCFGAGARAPGKAPCTNPALKGLFPSLAAAATDNSWPEECSISNRSDTTPVACELGNSKSKVRIALVGDSHAKHYTAAMQDLAKKNNWSVEVYVKGGCQFSFASRQREDTILTKACVKFDQNLEKILLAKNYDLIVTSQKSGVEWLHSKNQTEAEVAISGLVDTWAPLVAKGMPILAIKDNPRPIDNVIRCLEVKSAHECSALRASSLPFDPQVEAVKRMRSNLVSLAVFDDIYCDKTYCSPVIGNVVVYRDTDHLTSTFTRTLAKFIKPYIDSALAK